jgi:acylphosphatase
LSDLPALIARYILVSGRVHGVGFRAATVEAAVRIEIHGWVRNLPDGRVEIHAQGRATDLENFTDWVEQGPRWARVDDLSVVARVPDPNLRSFEIRW